MTAWVPPRQQDPPPDALFDIADIPAVVVPAPAESIEGRFLAFHEANPWVAHRLTVLALDMVERGHPRLGLKQLWEVLRWQYQRATLSGDGLKLNNDFTALYARLLMDSEPRLVGAFETRARRTR